MYALGQLACPFSLALHHHRPHRQKLTPYWRGCTERKKKSLRSFHYLYPFSPSPCLIGIMQTHTTHATNERIESTNSETQSLWGYEPRRISGWAHSVHTELWTVSSGWWGTRMTTKKKGKKQHDRVCISQLNYWRHWQWGMVEYPTSNVLWTPSPSMCTASGCVRVQCALFPYWQGCCPSKKMLSPTSNERRAKKKSRGKNPHSNPYSPSTRLPTAALSSMETPLSHHCICNLPHWLHRHQHYLSPFHSLEELPEVGNRWSSNSDISPWQQPPP